MRPVRDVERGAEDALRRSGLVAQELPADEHHALRAVGPHHSILRLEGAASFDGATAHLGEPLEVVRMNEPQRLVARPRLVARVALAHDAGVVHVDHPGAQVLLPGAHLADPLGLEQGALREAQGALRLFLACDIHHDAARAHGAAPVVAIDERVHRDVGPGAVAAAEAVFVRPARCAAGHRLVEARAHAPDVVGMHALGPPRRVGRLVRRVAEHLEPGRPPHRARRDVALPARRDDGANQPILDRVPHVSVLHLATERAEATCRERLFDAATPPREEVSGASGTRRRRGSTCCCRSGTRASSGATAFRRRRRRTPAIARS